MRYLLRLQNFIIPLAILLAGIGLQMLQPYPVEFVRNLVFDQYNRWQPRDEQGSPVVLIDIDERSLKTIGQFPWPRSVFAELVNKMTEAGSAAIAFDILFTEPDRTAPSEILPIWNGLRAAQNKAEWEILQASITEQITNPDDAFGRAMRNAPVVMATMMNDEVSSLPVPKAGIAIRAHSLTVGAKSLTAGAKSLTAGGQSLTAGNDQLDPMRSLPSSRFAIANRAVLNENAVGLGSINARIDPDGIIRRASLLYRAGGHVFPSLALESLRVAQRAGSIVLRASDVRGEGSYMSGFGLSRLKVGQLVAPIEPDGSMRIYFADSDTIETVSAYEILAPNFNADRLAGKIAFVGTSAAGLKDIRATPLNPATPGVEVHIQTVQQLISDTYLKRPIWVQVCEALATLISGLALIILVNRFSIVPGLTLLVVGMAGGALFSWHQFSTALLLIDPATPSVSVFACFLAAAFLHYLQTARERREVRNAFRYYLAPDMVEQIAGDPDRLKLGGETRNLTVLFTDIRGFTTIAETFGDAPEKLTHIINIFLTGMSRVIQERKGTIDKYIGDNIMAFWNAPAEVENHAYEACLTSLHMRTALDEVNAQLQNDPLLDGWPGEIRIGIGLNSGPTLVGNVGSDQRFNYSVMGDTVNVAARLEGQTKDYGVIILIGENTHAQAQQAMAAGAPPLAFIELDLIALKGKLQPERIFGVIGDTDFAQSADYAKLVSAHAALLRAYRARQWDEASELAAQIAGEFAMMAAYYTMLTKRIQSYRANPPDADWDGRYIAPSK